MALVITATLVSYGLGWLLGVAVLVPVLNAAVAWWVMARALGAGRTTRAIAVMLVWALTMAVASTVMSAMGWSRTGGDDLFLRAAYRDEMLDWVRTGIGAENEPAVFVPRHLGSAAVFAGASLATGGLLSMPMGAVLMNSMGEYVGALMAAGHDPHLLAILGWHPWAVVRIVGFVLIGVVLSGVLLSRVLRFPYSLAAGRRWLVLGLGLLVLDLALKWALAPAWGRLLRRIAGW